AGLEWLAGAAAPPQAVLLDLRMPILDGFEVLRRYRAEGGTAPVIALSAMDEKEAVGKAMRLGASDYLVKPIEPDELKQAIERCGLSRPPPLEEPQAAPLIPAVRPVEPPAVTAAVRGGPARRGRPSCSRSGRTRSPTASAASARCGRMPGWWWRPIACSKTRSPAATSARTSTVV